MKSTKEILKFALPAVIENFLQMLVGISDTFLVTRIGLSAVAGVSLANNIITVYQAVFIALGTILSSFLARKMTRQMINAGVKLTIFLGGLIGILTALFSQNLVRFFGGEGEVAALGTKYLMLVGGTVILLALMTSFGAVIRASGDSRTPMYASLFANVLNIILSAVLIFIFHMGVMGAAIGTTLSRALSLIYLNHKLHTKDLQPTKNFLKEKISKDLILLTLPAAGERLAMRLGDLVIMALIISLGDRVFAGNAIGESITQFNYMPAFGLATVTVILVAQEFGQENLPAIRSYIKRTYWLATSMMFSIGLLLFLASSFLSGLFTSDGLAIASSNTVILFSFLATFFVTGTTTYTAAFQGIGNAKLPLYTTIIGMLIIRVGLGYLLSQSFAFGLEGIWLAVLADNFFRFVFLKICFRRAVQKNFKI
ncbi:MATE family efflux transporter [Lactococcus garvieae]|uniref:Probable multidrug resistance protein NorM n=1 Tax=Lactococcus garvieae DCC43 TaxID=1231377 RepID=K2NYB6_9LACT|nr:MATE family efflux transporter [Lactococcus garvieae]EKF52558.1 Na+ driven multidrug efflux pump [Lactococcus garvieae DCC43]